MRIDSGNKMKVADWWEPRFALMKKPSVTVIAVIAAFVLGAIIRLVVFSRHFPLWSDEAWTGAIVGQPTLRATIEQSLMDPNAPSYFILMHFWTKWFGLSDSALRFPSLIFGVIAPLIAMLPSKGIERDVRLLWCGIVALWIPGFWYSQEARCYSLAFLLAMACTHAYVRLLAQPSVRNAVGWASLGCLMILTEYHSLLLIGCQGIGYLALHRKRAIRTWPAVLLYLPAVAWMWAHMPRVLQYADANAYIHPIVRFDNVLGILGFVVGNWVLAVLLLIVALVLGVLFGPIKDAPSNAWLAAATATVSAILLIAIGSLNAIFTTRYLMVFIPGISLGISLLAAHFGQRWKLVPVGIIILYGIFAWNWKTENDQADAKLILSFEHASRELEKNGIDQLVFLLDSPLTNVLQPSQLEALGGFFFRRQGLTIPITPIFLRPGDNPNERLLDAAATTPRSAILWLYVPSARNTAILSYPVRIEQINRAWFCSDFGTPGVVACHRR